MEGVSAFLLIIGLMLGFALGYGVRARISSRRRARALHYKTVCQIAPEDRFTSLDAADDCGVELNSPRLVPSHIDERINEETRTPTSGTRR